MYSSLLERLRVLLEVIRNVFHFGEKEWCYLIWYASWLFLQEIHLEFCVRIKKEASSIEVIMEQLVFGWFDNFEIAF